MFDALDQLAGCVVAEFAAPLVHAALLDETVAHVVGKAINVVVLVLQLGQAACCIVLVAQLVTQRIHTLSGLVKDVVAPVGVVT